MLVVFYPYYISISSVLVVINAIRRIGMVMTWALHTPNTVWILSMLSSCFFTGSQTLVAT